ncbi:hypothetical protein C8R44DRAFT_752729 [Mycena epipterygia]|nr:hypothetical protein C8R44DRAFT_752729 [Mycena epipterygia]
MMQGQNIHQKPQMHDRWNDESSGIIFGVPSLQNPAGYFWSGMSSRAWPAITLSARATPFIFHSVPRCPMFITKRNFALTRVQSSNGGSQFTAHPPDVSAKLGQLWLHVFWSCSYMVTGVFATHRNGFYRNICSGGEVSSSHTSLMSSEDEAGHSVFIIYAGLLSSYEIANDPSHVLNASRVTMKASKKRTGEFAVRQPKALIKLVQDERHVPGKIWQEFPHLEGRTTASHIANLGFPLLMWDDPGGHITGAKQIGMLHAFLHPVGGAMSNNINIYAGPIKCPPLLSYAGISSIGVLFRLYMVCNSLQGMDGLAAWGKRAMPSIQACTLGYRGCTKPHPGSYFWDQCAIYVGDSAWLHHLSVPVPWDMVIPSAYHKWQVWSFPVATIKSRKYSTSTLSSLKSQGPQSLLTIGKK